MARIGGRFAVSQGHGAAGTTPDPVGQSSSYSLGLSKSSIGLQPCLGAAQSAGAARTCTVPALGKWAHLGASAQLLSDRGALRF